VLLLRSLAGEISSRKQQSLREHLHACVACQKYADDSRRAVAGLGGFSFAANPDLQEKVFAALVQRAQQLEAAQPGRRRIVCVLRFQEDLSLQEMASVIGVPLTTVSSRIYRGLAALRAQLEEAQHAN
jgi:DNA-directed RNA polymerase specialized sigma24 family protein